MNFIFIQIFFFLLLFQSELQKDINNKQEKILEKENKYELINLTDKNFNTFVNNGKYNRWLILFYIETCYHCERALQNLNNILYKKQFKVINNIKFGIIDVSVNTKINYRFNISQVPQIILIENNSMIELDLYPNEKNFINFIESNISDSKNIFPVPKINLLKYYYLLLDNSIYHFVDKLDEFLKSYNINYATNPIIFILLYIIFCVVLWTIIFKVFFKFCEYKKKEKIEIKNEEENDVNDKSKDNFLKQNKHFRKRRCKK